MKCMVFRRLGKRLSLLFLTLGRRKVVLDVGISVIVFRLSGLSVGSGYPRTNPGAVRSRGRNKYAR